MQIHDLRSIRKGVEDKVFKAFEINGSGTTLMFDVKVYSGQSLKDPLYSKAYFQNDSEGFRNGLSVDGIEKKANGHAKRLHLRIYFVKKAVVMN